MFASFFKDSRHRKNNSTAVLSEVLLSCLLQLALAGRLALPLKLLHTAAAASKFCVELLTSQQNLRISQGNSPSFHNKASKLNMTCKTYSERKKRCMSTLKSEIMSRCRFQASCFDPFKTCEFYS